MNLAYLFLIICGFLIYLSHTASSTTTAQPDQVIGFFRHGARGPLSGYDSTWSYDDWGMLTSVGMRQEFLLGQILQKKYSKIFGATYDPYYILALSDYTYRCVESIVAITDGIYYGKGPALKSTYTQSVGVPPFQDPSVQDVVASLSGSLASIPGQRVPVIVDTVDSSNAQIFARFYDNSYCNNAGNWLDQNDADAATTAAWAVFKPTIYKFNTYLPSSQKLTTPYSVTIYGDFMLVDVQDGRPLPYGITDPALIMSMNFAFSWFVFHQEYAQLIQRQVSAYYIVQEILTQMNYWVTGSYMLYNGLLYGAHDYNLYALLAAFNIVNDTCIMANFNSYAQTQTLAYPACVYPGFASNMIFELYYPSATTAYVKLFYNNIWIPLCNGKDCSYNDFVIFANNAIGNMDDTAFNKACGN